MATERESIRKRNGGEVCLLGPDDFRDDDEVRDDEVRVEGGDIFRSDDDIGYFLERIRMGNCPIKGRKGRKL